MIYHQKKGLTLKDTSEELFPEETKGLPFMCYFDEGRLFTGQHIPWHWHERVELNYLATGSFWIHTPDRDVEVQQGDVVFVNRNVMHAYDLTHEVEYYSLMADPAFLSGGFGSYLDQKYFSRIFTSRNLSLVHLKPDTPRRVRIVGSLLKAVELLQEEPFGYELLLREELGRFFLQLTEEFRETLARESGSSVRDLERMKIMLQFIYDHYQESVGLEDIAGAALISARECTRCFRRAINRSPVRFLIEYRTQMAAMMLLRTDDSISDIAAKCGFVSDSYFGKTFRDIYGCTPREYRKTM